MNNIEAYNHGFRYRLELQGFQGVRLKPAYAGTLAEAQTMKRGLRENRMGVGCAIFRIASAGQLELVRR